MNTNKIVKVLRVHDTRQYEEIGDKWIPIPGTGEFNTCSRCGRQHEVHVYVLLDNDTSAIIGSGCCKQESLDIQSRITSLVSASLAVNKFQSRLAKEEAELAKFLKAEQEVNSLPLPTIKPDTCIVAVGRRKGETIETRIMGDASISLWDGQYDSRDRDLLIHNWREKRLEERGFKYYHGMGLKEAVEHTKKQLKKATQRMEKS